MADMNWLRDLDAITSSDAATSGVTLDATEGATEIVAETPREPNTQHVDQSKYDRHLFDRSRNELPALDKAVDESAREWEHTEALARDIYSAIYKPAPNLVEVDEAYAKNATALDEALSTDVVQRLRAQAQLDAFKSALATEVLTRQLVETLVRQQKDEPPTPPTPPTPPSDEQGDENGSGAGAGSGGASAKGDAEAQAEYEEALAEYDAKKAAYDAAVTEQQAAQASALRSAARKAAAQAAEQIEEVDAALATFGGDEDEIGSGWGLNQGRATNTGDIAERARLARTIAANPKLQLIAALAGKMRFIASAAQRAKAEHIPDEVVGVTVGDNLQRVLSSELAVLADDDLADLFYAKLLDHRLVEYELSGSEPQGKGPIVVCTDESNSTNGLVNAWITAAALALLSIAAKEGRDFRWVHFGGPSEVLAEDYAKGRGTPDAVLASATHFFNGGTSFDTPLASALDAIEDATYKNADVIFITDGQCHTSDATLVRWNEVKRERDFSCYGILVGPAMWKPWLEPFCDTITSVIPNAVGSEADADVLAPAFSI